MTLAIIFEIIFIACTAYALARGGTTERRVALILASCFTASAVTFAEPVKVRFLHLSWPVLIIDIVTLVALRSAASRSEKSWPQWITAMQGVTVISHLAPLTHLINGWTYGLFNQLWSYPQLILLALGTRWHRRYLMRHAGRT